MKACLLFLTVAMSIVSVHESFGQNQTERFNAMVAPQRDAVGDCYKAQTSRFAALSCEPAETVVDAAFGRCVAFEKAYKDVMVMNTDAEFMSIADAIVAKTKITIRQFLLARVLEVRLQAGRC